MQSAALTDPGGGNVSGRCEDGNEDGLRGEEAAVSSWGDTAALVEASVEELERLEAEIVEVELRLADLRRIRSTDLKANRPTQRIALKTRLSTAGGSRRARRHPHQLN